MSPAGKPSRRALLVGYGRMGKLIESLSSEYGCEIVGHVNRSNVGRPDEWPQADVAIDRAVCPWSSARPAGTRTRRR
jgi:hypothetical protein